jgi:hypothetical protein
MHCARVILTACVVKGLPNWRDYAYKNSEMLLEEKGQRQMADTEQDLNNSNDEISSFHSLVSLDVPLRKILKNHFAE